jgi:hypothetical protein
MRVSNPLLNPDLLGNKEFSVRCIAFAGLPPSNAFTQLLQNGNPRSPVLDRVCELDE